MDGPYFSKTSDGTAVLVLDFEYEVYAIDPWRRTIATTETREAAERIAAQLSRDGVRAGVRIRVHDEIAVPV